MKEVSLSDGALQGNIYVRARVCINRWSYIFLVADHVCWSSIIYLPFSNHTFASNWYIFSILRPYICQSLVYIFYSPTMHLPVTDIYIFLHSLTIHLPITDIHLPISDHTFAKHPSYIFQSPAIHLANRRLYICQLPIMYANYRSRMAISDHVSASDRPSLCQSVCICVKCYTS